MTRNARLIDERITLKYGTGGGAMRALIEQVFAKLKTLLRKAEERTIEATWRRIGELLDHFQPSECANYLRNSGYASV